MHVSANANEPGFMRVMSWRSAWFCLMLLRNRAALYMLVDRRLCQERHAANRSVPS